MNVFLYNINKRVNSTKQPLPSEGKSITVQLKEETSFLNPTLIIGKDIVSGLFSPSSYNYVQIPYWQRYYFINDWKYKNGVWECYCSVDPLASFKYQIGDTQAYILRSSSTYDGSIIDTFYPAKTNISITRVNVASSWYAVAPSGGSYILGALNYQTGNKVGAVSYYALTASQFSSVMAYLFSDNIFNAENIYEIGEGLYKSLFDPFQYIVSCMWFPFSTSAFGSAQDTVKVGYWSTGVNGIIVSALAEKTYVTATIPDHPQINRGSYLNHSPYTRLTLYIPPFGAIPIDTNFIEIGHYLYSAVLIDHITGQATLRISISPSSYNLNEFNIITERTAMIGVPIQISQLMPDYVNTLTSLGNTLQSAFMGNILGVASGIMSAIESQMPKVSTQGANGSFIECIQNPVLIAEHIRIAEENKAEYGRPLCSTMTIKSVPGYIQCGEDDHSFPCTKAEADIINQYMKNGFFYE